MSDEFLERAIGKIGEETVSHEPMESEFFFNNPVLASPDGFTVYAGILGMVSSLEATEDCHKAINSLLALAKEYYCKLDEARDKELKEKIGTTIDNLETSYKESLYWLRPIKRLLAAETEVLTRQGAMPLTDWASAVEKAEKAVFAKEGPFKILQEIMRSLVNNRIVQALEKRKKNYLEWRKGLFPEGITLTYKEIIQVSFPKVKDLQEVEKSKEGVHVLNIPDEMIVRGPLVHSAPAGVKPEKEYVRFGVSPWYNIQRDLTSAIQQENTIESFIHFGRALKNLETQIIAFLGPEHENQLLLVELKKDEKNNPIINPTSFIKLVQLLHELNLWLTASEKWTLVELLEIYELKRDILSDLEDFVSYMLPIFMRVLMRNPNLKKKGLEETFSTLGEAH